MCSSYKCIELVNCSRKTWELNLSKSIKRFYWRVDFDYLSPSVLLGDRERDQGDFFVLKNTFSSFVNCIKVILKFQLKGLEEHGAVRSLSVTDQTKFGNFFPTFQKFASIVNFDKVKRVFEIIHYKILSWNLEVVVIEHFLWSNSGTSPSQILYEYFTAFSRPIRGLSHITWLRLGQSEPRTRASRGPWQSLEPLQPQVLKHQTMRRGTSQRLHGCIFWPIVKVCKEALNNC